MILLHPLPLMLARFCGIRLHWPSADELHTSADESCSLRIVKKFGRFLPKDWPQ